MSGRKMDFDFRGNGLRRTLHAILISGTIELAFFTTAARAVILWSTADPETNTTRPADDLAGSGWDLQGDWGAFLGTPIGTNCFITAKHIGGTVGDLFVLRGVAYKTIASFDDPATDLRIWQIDGSFSVWALLYEESGEAGKRLVVFGRGTQRGEPVSVDETGTAVLRGWLWGPVDMRKRWGENLIESIENGDAARHVDSSRSRAIGQLLKANFDAEAGPNEAHLSGGDSGGGVFVDDDGAWKLAGINYAVDGSYNYSDAGPGFAAAVFDERGLFSGMEGDWKPIDQSEAAEPGAFYATRISSRVEWIKSVLTTVPTLGVIVQTAENPGGPYSDVAAATVHETARTIVIPITHAAQFYRLSSGSPLTISAVTVTTGQLRMKY